MNGVFYLLEVMKMIRIVLMLNTLLNTMIENIKNQVDKKRERF